MPNFLATLALALYPLFGLMLFGVTRASVATTLTLMVAEMTLPPQFNIDFPLIPPFDKATVPTLTVMAGTLLFAFRQLRRSRPFRGVELFLLLLIIARFITTRTNGDPIHHTKVTLSGESLMDFLSDTQLVLILYWIPFFLGRTLFRSSRDLVSLARVMAIGAAIYTLPILVEIRLSPQICSWIYGYGAQDFGQTIRFGGYRPTVLFSHGLGLSLYMLFCTLMAVGLARAKHRIGPFPGALVWLFLAMVLVLCKSTGTIVYAMVLIPLLFFVSRRKAISIGFVLLLFVVIYPLLRLANAIPIADIGDFLNGINPDRAQSLMYRLNMEQESLDLVRKRFIFGWGGYGRAFKYDVWSTKATTVLDSFAFIQLATRGMVGYVTFFLMFIGPVWIARRNIDKIRDPGSRVLVCALALIVCVTAFDLLINATLFPFLTLLAGALVGLTRGIIAEEQQMAQQQMGPAYGYPPGYPAGYPPGYPPQYPGGYPPGYGNPGAGST